MRFGHLIANSQGVRSGKKVTWVCSCDCGGTVTVMAFRLVSGEVTSCACRNKLKQPSPLSNKTCVICGSPFTVPKWRRETAKYCSYECRSEGNRRTRAEFWDLCTPTTSGCWMFHNAAPAHPYGRFTLDGHQTSAHRASWIICHGAIPTGMCVCHKCDTPGCVNPDHLFLGTMRENNLDKLLKGRNRAGGAKGCRNPRSKLNPKAVREIRASKLPSRKLAALYGVEHNAVLSVRNGATWSHVD